MVTKNDICLMKNILSELKGDFVKEIKNAIKDKIKRKELKTEIKTKLQCEIEKNTHRNIDEKLKQTYIDDNEKIDTLNMVLTDIREKIAKEKKRIAINE